MIWIFVGDFFVLFLLVIVSSTEKNVFNFIKLAPDGLHQDYHEEEKKWFQNNRITISMMKQPTPYPLYFENLVYNWILAPILLEFDGRNYSFSNIIILPITLLSQDHHHPSWLNLYPQFFPWLLMTTTTQCKEIITDIK